MNNINRTYKMNQRTENVWSKRWMACLTVVLLATAGAGTAAAQSASVLFLQIEPDSRSAGMGNAGVAVADNAYALFWNPAGLAFQRGVEASLTHSTWLPEFDAGLYYEYLVGKYHVDNIGTFGAHVTFLNLGEHEIRDDNNELLGEFRSYDLAVGASYGRQINDRLGLGGGLRFIYSNLAPSGSFDGVETQAGVTWAFDLGALYRSRPFQLGKYHVDNIGTFGAHVTFLNLGEHEIRDDNNELLGEFRSYDLAVGASYGRQINDRLGLGGGLRFIYSNLAPSGSFDGVETQAGVTWAFDLGALYRSRPFQLGNIPTTLSAGVNLANLGPSIRYSKTCRENVPCGDPIPSNIRLGYSFTFDLDEYNQIRFANDFTKMLIRRDSTGADPYYKAIFSSWQPIEVNRGTSSNPDIQSLSVLQQFTVGLGAEYWYNQLFALRLGYFYEDPNNGNRKFMTFGAGIRYNIVGVDFSYIFALEEDNPLANTMRFSLLLNLIQ